MKDFLDNRYKIITWLQERNINIEAWKQINNFPNYEVSTEGRIRKKATGKILKTERTAKKQSPRVVLAGKRIYVADIITETFFLNPNGLKYYYLDGDNQNTRLSNLSLLPTDFENIKTLSGYMINPSGKIYSIMYKKILNPSIDASGCYRIWLRKNGDYRNFSVAKLVAEQYIANPNNFRYVEHINGDKSNNYVSNLIWAKFPEDNKLYWLNSSNTKLKPENLPIIKKMDTVGISKRKIAAVFDVSVDAIIDFLKGETWNDFA